MSHSLANPAVPDIEPTSSVVTTAGRQRPALVSEQEVVFTTAVAFAPSGMHHRQPLGTPLLAAFRSVHIRLPEPRPICARREASYFEGARMSRQMEHL
jgi:hypothetical protein